MNNLKAAAAFVVVWALSGFVLKFLLKLTGLYQISGVWDILSFVVPVALGVLAARLAYDPSPITLADFTNRGKRYEPEPEPASRYWASSEDVTQALNSPKREASQMNIGARFLWNAHGNILTVGGSRGGKGVNLVLPALLEDCLKWNNAPSFIVLDPKGENCAVAAAYLKSIDYDVHVINPFGIPEIRQFGQARLNPFDLFSAVDLDFTDKVDMIRFSLLPVSTKSDTYWDEAARDLIRDFIGHMMTQADEPKTFKTLYNWLHYAGDARSELLVKMVGNDALDGTISAGAAGIVGMLDDDGGKTVGNIFGTARTALSVFADLRLRQTVSGSDFTLKTIAKKETAIFICVNPADLRRVSSWMRIMFNLILDELPKSYNPDRKVVLLMDEFPTIGRLQSFENNFAFLPGYNVTLWPIVQDLNQLKTHYPESWETFIGSAHIKHWLAIGDNFTAQYVSDRMPRVKDDRDEKDKSGQLKPLLEPWEVRQNKSILTEIKGLDKWIEMQKIPYWDQNDNGANNPFR